MQSVLTPLVLGLVDRAKEIARWQTGMDVTIAEPRLASRSTDGGTFPSSGDTIEFRFDVFGPAPRTYVVTISEVPLR